MDMTERLAADVSQLTKRVDDLSMRLAVVEVQQKNIDKKIEEIKQTINRVGYWVTTLVLGSFVLALLRFIFDGGLAKAAGF